MIKFTGHELDAVVVLTVDSEELVQRLLQRAETEGRADDTEEVIRRRQEVYAEQTEPLIEVYRDRNLLDRGRRHGRGRRGHRADLRRARGRRARADRRPPWASATAASRSRRPSRSTRCGSPGCSSARRSSCCATSVRAGITTGELDAIAEENIRAGGGSPVVPRLRPPAVPGDHLRLGQRRGGARHPGRPGARGRRRDLDRLRCDRRRLARRRGHHGRRSGEVRADVLELMRVTEESLWAGIAAARLGGRVTDISHAVETYVRSQPHPSGGSYGILEDFTGHGIGTAMHQPPNVPNYGRPGRGPKLERGLALAVEPMVTLGSKHTELADDEWTVVTDDGSWAAHFEHTFTLTPDGGPAGAPALRRRASGSARRRSAGPSSGLSGLRRGTRSRRRVPSRSCCSPSGGRQQPPTTSTSRSSGSPGCPSPSCRGSTWRTTRCPRSTSDSGPASSSAGARGTPATPRRRSRRRR